MSAYNDTTLIFPYVLNDSMIGDVQIRYILYKKLNNLKFKGTSWNRDTKHKGCIVLYQSINRDVKAGSLKMNTALEYSTGEVQEGGRRCKKSTLNDLVHLTPLRIPLMNPPLL